jgi:hypothetical protein
MKEEENNENERLHNQLLDEIDGGCNEEEEDNVERSS